MSRTAEIRAVAAKDAAGAELMLSALLADLFGLTVRDLSINADQYSLNSLNGFFSCEHGACFFKFHQEEGEEEMRGEYYRADILARAGLPVDQPILTSTEPGEQILVYRRRSDPRFADVLLAQELAPAEPQQQARALAAEAVLNDQLLAVAKASLQPITPAQSRAEPIHRLFHERLIEPATGAYPAGRLAQFYIGQDFTWPGLQANWAQISKAPLQINGLRYQHNLAELFDAAHHRLHPERLADAGGIVAHGDAHNANVWYQRGSGATDSLAFFDPAFAGEQVPALLAEIKATFHNSLAHPLWLYDSAKLGDRFQAQVSLQDGVLNFQTDWAPGPLRAGLLAIKAKNYWAPWLAHLQTRGMLPADWEQVMRLALFLCPTMVMNLRAGAGRHLPTSSAIGLSIAIMMGSSPISGRDLMTAFFDSIRPPA